MSDSALHRATARPRHHHLRQMIGRDPEESHRAASPLELLYDLTLVVAFGVAGGQLAHALAAGHVAVAVVGFAFAMFAAIWAWINFSWFASAYDTDDWYMRLAVLMQMAGVLILALGLPEMFHGLENGWEMHINYMVIGYVVMRIAMVALWVRAALSDPPRRQVCLYYAGGILLAQFGWVGLTFLHLSFLATLPLIVVLLAMELLIPWYGENRHSSTPWHPHHIAERYGLLTIIALGEGVIGTTSALEALISAKGWSADVATVLIAGLSLTFGCWWMYFNVPYAELLEKYRERGFLFGYSHLILYSAIAAIGAGLHVVAYAFEGKSMLSDVGVLLTVAVPVAIYICMVYLLSPALRGAVFSSLHLSGMVMTLALLLAVVGLVGAGVNLGTGLLLVMLAPWLTVLVYELGGYRHMEVH